MDTFLSILYPVIWLAVFGGIAWVHHRWYTAPQRRKKARLAAEAAAAAGDRENAARTPVVAAVARPAPLAADAQPPIALAEWLQRANHQPDRTPHIAATGPSGSGKSTLVLAMLQNRPGRCVICTPKSKRADRWADLPVVRLRATDMSFAPIGEAISAVYREMLRRNAVDAEVDDDWITLVIDEFSTVIGKLPKAGEQVLDMVTLGRSSRIRVIILATETNVKAWGWEGRGEARNNVLFFECEEETRNAVMFRWGKGKEPIDTSGVPALAGRPMDQRRAWPLPQAEASATDDADRLLRRTFSEPLDGLENAENVPEISEGSETISSALESNSSLSVSADLVAEIAHFTACLQAGKGKTETLKTTPTGYAGRDHKRLSDLYEQVKASLAPIATV